MTLQTTLPHDLTPAVRLREYLKLVEELSLHHDPHQMLLAYRERARFVVPADHIASFSCRGVQPGMVKITRSTLWPEMVNPWKQSDRVPVVASPMVLRLMEAGHPIKIDSLEVPEDDPIAPYTEGMRSLLSAPIFYEGKPLYMVWLLRRHADAFTLDELATLLLTSNLVGRATSHLVLADELRSAYAALDREFGLVGQIQKRLLPAVLPQVPGVTFAAHYETSTRAGGDYYDFFKLPGDRFGWLIADVSGHGPPAAVLMAMLRTMLRTLTGEHPETALKPSKLLAALNRGLLESVMSGQFATAFYGVYDPATRELSYSSAGHNPPRVLLGSDGSVTSLDVEPGIPLGLTEPYHAAEATRQFQQGDRLLLYTDGVTETFNSSGAMFGVAGIDASLSVCNRTPDDMLECLLASLRGFADGIRPDDDRTLVAVAFD